MFQTGRKLRIINGLVKMRPEKYIRCNFNNVMVERLKFHGKTEEEQFISQNNHSVIFDIF